jgi:tRNA-modifying protein YgfZ
LRRAKPEKKGLIIISRMNTPTFFHGGVLLSHHWGLIRAQGLDAVKFLQGQLTNDVASLSDSAVRLAGFCSAKGRLQASFVLWRAAPDELLLACSSSLLAATLKRLSMFVMRAKCQLSDATNDFSTHGLVGDAARSLMGDAAVWSHRATPHGTLLRMPDVQDQPRAVLFANNNFTTEAAITLDQWRWLDVQSGIPTIEAATADAFVPQMLNYELLGGVDFKKGCYPGQEVVARSQYRGTLKRRMFLFDCDGAQAAPGQEVFHSADADQPAGLVVNAAPTSTPGASGCAALIEVKLSALESGSLHLGSTSGALLRLAALPYAVPSDAAP